MENRKILGNFNVPRSGAKMMTMSMMSSSTSTSMVCDEDSRDSGCCDMEVDELMKTTFPMMNEIQHFQNLQSLKDDEDEDSLCEELMKLVDTEDRENRAPQRIYDESPKSRALFARPVLAMRKNCNFQSQPQQQQKKEVFSRKRTFAGFEQVCKKIKIENSDFEQPSTSARILTTSMKFQRTHSSSILETRSQQHKSSDFEFPATNYRLKTITTNCSNAFRRIAAATLCELLVESDFAARFMLIDCRYPYEFNGGHIRGARNVYDPENLAEIFYTAQKEQRVPIFYCEYSQKRGPSMAYALRRMDRQRNELRYPHCDYQEMYVLDKGYRNFYYEQRNSCGETFCEPDNYIQMDDSRFSGELKKWNFHKKSAIGTSVRVVESRSRTLLRQQSADSHFSFSSTTTQITSRSTSRRPLFTQNLSSPTSLSSITEVRTPSPDFISQQPLKNPTFS